MKTGLKVWSPNMGYLKPALKLFEAGVYDYIELYAVPDSLEYLAAWQNIAKRGIEFAIHAPHFSSGLDFSDPNKESLNARLIEQTKRWSEGLNASYTLFHPGIGGAVSQTVRQMKKLLNGFSFIVENKPFIVPTKSGDKICVGASLGDIELILNETGCGFCLDIGHAICAANYQKIDIYESLKSFKSLSPKALHISDNKINSIYDAHLNFGFGEFDFKRIFKALSGNGVSEYIAIETNKSSSDNLDDFAKDCEFLKGVLNIKN